MTFVLQCLAVALGGAIGAVLRFLVAVLCTHLFGKGFPVGTLVVNLTGSLFLGWFLTTIHSRIAVPEFFRLAVATGIVGAYTTFSALTYESTLLLDEGATWKAWLNLIGSLVLGLIAVRLGMLLAR